MIGIFYNDLLVFYLLLIVTEIDKCIGYRIINFTKEHKNMKLFRNYYTTSTKYLSKNILHLNVELYLNTRRFTLSLSVY